VHSELTKWGFHYDRIAMAHDLVNLVKDNILTIIGIQDGISMHKNDLQLKGIT
jgi:hypothetical protein